MAYQAIGTLRASAVLTTTYDLEYNVKLSDCDWKGEDEGVRHYKSPIIKLQHRESGQQSSWQILLLLEAKSVKYSLVCQGSEPNSLLDDGLHCNISVYIGSMTQGLAEFTKIFKPNISEPEWRPLLLADDRRKYLKYGGTLSMRLLLTAYHAGISTLDRFHPLPQAQVPVTELSTTLVWEAPGVHGASDVLLLCGGEEFQTHKSVLFRSPEFCSLISERTQGVGHTMVEIHELEPSTLKVILEFLHTGKFSELDQDATFAVLEAANTFGLDPLKHFCFLKLLDCLNDENVGILFVAANVYKARREVVALIREFWERNMKNKFKIGKEFSRLLAIHTESFVEM